MTRSTSPSDPLLILATGNRAKGRELAALLADLPYRIQDLAEFPGVVLPPEGETSYAENALGKARAVTAATGLLALAEDSGIEVDAFDGRQDDARELGEILDAVREIGEEGGHLPGLGPVGRGQDQPPVRG